MAVVALLILIPLALVLRDDETGSLEAGPEPRPVTLGERKSKRKLGVEYRLPAGWNARTKDGVLRLGHRSRDVAIAISTPGPRGDADAIREQALAAIDDLYRKVSVLSRIRDQRLGGLPARGVVAAAQSKDGGAPLRILLATARGKRRAYLIEVFASTDAAGLIAAQSLLNELRFTR